MEAVRLTETQLKELEALPHVLEVHYEDLKLSLHMSSARHNLIRVLTFLQSQDVIFRRLSELPTANVMPSWKSQGQSFGMYKEGKTCCS